MGQCICSEQNQQKCCAEKLSRMIDGRRRSTVVADDDLLQIDSESLQEARKQFKEAQVIPGSIGHRVLVEFLLGRPNLVAAFHINANTNTAATLENAQILKMVGQKLSGFLQDLLKLADQDSQQVLRNCQSLGRVHFHHGIKYNREDFQWFKKCVITVICHSNKMQYSSSTLTVKSIEDPTDNGWDTIMDYVVTQMLQGILQETVKNGHNEPGIIIQFTDECDANSIGGCSVDESHRSSDHSSFRSICSVTVSHNLLEPLKNQRKTSACSLGDLIENYTLEERRLMRKLWRHAKLKPIGELIYADIFEIKPELRRFFDLPIPDENTLLTGEELKHEQDVIKVQGCRLEGFLDNVIHLIAHMKMDKAEEVCRRVGTIHYHKRAHFTADNWLVFKRVIIFHLLEDDTACTHPEQGRAVLHKFMLFVTKQMKNAYLEAAMKKCSSPPGIKDI